MVRALTNITHIGAELPLIPDSQNGNSAIISYQLDIDDGEGGAFRPVGGYDPISLKTIYSIREGIVRGRTYRLRYRTLNGVGFSQYSPLLYATAANVPGAPAAPRLVSATGASITMSFQPTPENGGSQVLYYELWIDQGVLGSAFS